MTVKVPLWAALSLCAGSLTLGAVWGQGGKDDAKKPAPDGQQGLPVLTEYPYLPDRYGEAYIPSVADWQAVRLTALGASTTRLTEHFTRQHLTCFADRKSLILTLDLLPQPSWKLFAGGKFTAPPEKVKPDLQKAIDAAMALVHAFFPEVADKDVKLQLFLNSESVGTWQNGALTLNVERSDVKK